MKTNLCRGTKPRTAGAVTPIEDRTRKRVTGGIFLTSATMSDMSVASEACHHARPHGQSRDGSRGYMLTHDNLYYNCSDLVWMPISLATLLFRVPCLSITTNRPSDEFEGVTNSSIEGRHP